MHILISRRIWGSAALLTLGSAVLPAQKAAVPQQPGLRIEDTFLSDSEGGEKLPSSHTFSAGDQVVLEFKIGGFAKTGDPPRANLEYEVRAIDDQGTLLAPPERGAVDVEITPEDKHWRPRVRYSVQIPPVPRKGEHKFLIYVKDKVSKAEVRGEIPVRVSSVLPDPPAKLSIFDVRFFRSEEDRNPLSPDESFHPGEKLYSRFYLTGYQFGPKNAYRVEYGISLRNTSDKVLLSVPKAASEGEESFYPKAYVQCAFQVDLQKTLAAGQYVLIISARDLVGNQEIESKFPFNVK